MSRVCQHAIYPFIHSFSNVRRADDQLRPIMIPDVLPGNLPRGGDFSMVAGDFLEVYGVGQENFGEYFASDSLDGGGSDSDLPDVPPPQRRGMLLSRAFSLTRRKM